MSLDLIREQLELHIDDCRDEIAELCAGHATALESMNAEHAAALSVLQGELERAVNAMAALNGDTRAESFDTDSDIVRGNSPSDVRTAPSPAALPGKVPVSSASSRVAKAEIPPRSKYDYTRVAQVARVALAGGQPVSAAVATTFDVSVDMARQLITRARTAGHEIPTATALRPSKPQGAPPKYDRADVAAVAREAIAAGEPVGKAVAKEFNVSGSMGAWLVQQARRAGEDIPKSPNGGGRPRKHRPTVVFVSVPEPVVEQPVVELVARKGRQPGGPMEWPKREPVIAAIPVDLTTEDPAVDPLAQLARCKLTLEMVALIYLEAREQNLPGARVLAERFGVHRTVANRWLGLCREGRLLPGRDEAQFDPDAPAKVLGAR